MDLLHDARGRLGYETFRPGQEEAARAVLAGRDTLVVMPTGSGKSAIYQLTSLLISGPTIVVSPLLALQRDQVHAIAQQGAEVAVELNSTLSESEREDALAGIADGEVHLVLLAPEQLTVQGTLDRLRHAQPSLLVVDEAHCISEWGHDFRPDYLRLGVAADALGRPPVLALTATASPPVREEIVERLGLEDPAVIVRGFDRPNIRLEVQTFHDARSRDDALAERVHAAPKPGLVYTATRRRAEELAELLCDEGIEALPYHGGLATAVREETQAAFMEDEVEVVVATIAFGMGVDKPNVRFVFHAEISESVDAYYQEIGRGGRDGEPAEAVLFYRPEDVGLRRFFAGSGVLKGDEVEQVLEVVRDADEPVDVVELREETGLSRSKLAAVVGKLEDAGAVEVRAGGEVVAADEDVEVAEVAEEAVEAQERRRELQRSRVEMMRGYAELRACRRGYILNYFGEPAAGTCGNCDNCESGVAEETAPVDEPFPLGARVVHEAWGKGAVQRYESDKVVVLFDDGGYKTLALDLVVEQGLLRPAR